MWGTTKDPQEVLDRIKSKTDDKNITRIKGIDAHPPPNRPKTDAEKALARAKKERTSKRQRSAAYKRPLKKKTTRPRRLPPRPVLHEPATAPLIRGGCTKVLRIMEARGLETEEQLRDELSSGRLHWKEEAGLSRRNYFSLCAMLGILPICTSDVSRRRQHAPDN